MENRSVSMVTDTKNIAFRDFHQLLNICLFSWLHLFLQECLFPVVSVVLYYITQQVIEPGTWSPNF